MNRIPPQRLHQLRNDISIASLIEKQLGLPNKHREGFFRFLCPECQEFNTAVNPNTNLARCFTCARNFNTIDLVMAVNNCSFLVAVEALSALLPAHANTARNPKN